MRVKEAQADAFMDALLECGALVATIEVGADRVAGTGAVVAHFDSDMPQVKPPSC